MTNLFTYPRLHFDRHIYRPSHGPQQWPWWRLAKLRIVHCTHDPYHYFWITPISFNIWLYTRWGALCASYHFRRGIYCDEEFRK